MLSRSSQRGLSVSAMFYFSRCMASFVVMVRVCIAQLLHHPDFVCFHEFGLRLGFMIVALQMQNAMDGQVRKMRLQRLVLILCFFRHDRRTQDDVAHQYRFFGQRESQHIGCVVLAAISAVQGARSEEHTSELQSLMRISY